MANALRVKTDIVNELRNKIYYNQLEIQRVLENPATISHRDAISKITELLSENVIAASSIDLMEQYLPTPKQQEQPSSDVVTEEGVTKVQ